jgi:hypothetical protein
MSNIVEERGNKILLFLNKKGYAAIPDIQKKLKCTRRKVVTSLDFLKDNKMVDIYLDKSDFRIKYFAPKGKTLSKVIGVKMGEDSGFDANARSF